MGAPTNAFTAEYGTQQGRIESAQAPAGTHGMQLGHALAGQMRFVAAGDVHKVTATFDATGLKKIRATARLRAAELPDGWSWRLRMSLLDGGINESDFADRPIDRTTTATDLAVPIECFIEYQASATIFLQFAVVLDGPPGEVIEAELPGALIDALVGDTVPSGAVDISARNPEPGESQIPLDYTVQFSATKLVSPCNLFANQLDVYINGEAAALAGVVQSGFSGGFDFIVGVEGVGQRCNITPDVPFEPLSTVTVEVRHNGVTVSSWSFTAADTIAPVIESAFAPSPTTVRVVFDEPIDEATATDPSSYVLTLLGGAPAVTPAVVSVEFEAPSTVVLTLSTLMTRGALYQVAVTDVADIFGNAITAPLNTAQFTGYRWPVPAGRRTKLFEMLPENVRVQDEQGEHERFLGVMQELFDLYYGVADRALDIIDPDFAPIEAVDLMLRDLGNPFEFLELTETERRILAQTLLAIYKTKGTGPGIVSALQFFLGIEATIRVYAWAPYGIGEAIIGQTLVLGSSEQSDLYTFEVVIESFLTATELRNLTAIVDYMKVAHEHWRLIAPTPPVNIDHWQLDFSRLDFETILH